MSNLVLQLKTMMTAGRLLCGLAVRVMEVATALLVGGSDAAEIDCDGSEIPAGGTAAAAAATPARPPTATSHRDSGGGSNTHIFLF